MEFRVGALARADKRRTGIQGPASIVKTDCRDDGTAEQAALTFFKGE